MSDPVKNEKYNAILDKAHDLFWKFGIRRVTIEEVCREAGVSKMTFYRFFPNKIELAIQVLKELFDKTECDYRKLMDQDIPFEEKVKQQIILKFEGTNDISAELVKDIYDNTDSELFKFWQAKADDMLQMIIDDYSIAQEKGWIRKDLKLEFLPFMSSKIVEMASDPKLQAMFPDMQSLIMEIANMFFFGILPREKEK